MNFYLKQPSFAPVLGLFAAKYRAIWCKTQRNMVQNAVCFGAKRKVKWCKTQGKMPLNAVQNAAKCETESINIHYDCINKPFPNHETHG